MEYHQLYDIYNDYDGIANLKTVNDSAGIRAVKVDKRIIDLLKFSIEMHKKTNGKVNVAYGAVLEIWHKYRTEGTDPKRAKVPTMSELEEANKHTSIDDIIINEAESTVYLADKAMRLDVGAVAKGYACQMVCEEVKKSGFNSALISVGGNVCAIGRRGEEDLLWSVGIQNPNKNEGGILKTVAVADMSVVTSGTYERFYTVEGVQYHHIIDPSTHFPSRHFMSVTVISSDSGLADALTTALFNMPIEEGLALIEGTPQTEAMWVKNDNSIKTSSGFTGYCK
jgi:thiamine biosynthesis lipoprotein